MTGRGVYVYDMSFPNMLHLKVKRIPVSHAYLSTIDSTNAQNIYGVRAIVTAKDFPDRLFGKGLLDTPILAREKVRYVGEVVAAVGRRKRRHCGRSSGSDKRRIQGITSRLQIRAICERIYDCAHS